ncbi:Proline--tRNA ligase [Saliniradius amylolyticus]|uniref:Proline--tRNA ligase n=1 Tax=Saliniradius amylolyticus TaxID=2183582 RepID=A0A2S2E2M1_9ALTE|nr:DUF423 domain-containing protein [Saliniradius amylolyticus]AWL11510.1 Proline--tRNA ligase [Saliniradius amylolyticus]
MKWLLVMAAFFGLSGVVLGAFGAHGLKGRLTESLLSAFETGVQYQFYHALALLALVLLYRFQPSELLIYSGWTMVAGVLLFSGSLYLLSLTGMKWLGPVTPVGGILLITGWLLLMVTAVKEAMS